MKKDNKQSALNKLDKGLKTTYKIFRVVLFFIGLIALAAFILVFVKVGQACNFI